MDPIFTSKESLFAIMAITVALGFYLQRFKGFHLFGPPLIVIIISIILANFKIVPFESEVYGVVAEYTVPLAIAMLLLSVDLKEMAKLSIKPLLAIIFAVLSIGVVTLAAGLFFAPIIDEGWKVAGMFVGTYTGGSANLTAIGYGLDATSTTFAAANAADYVVAIPLLILMFAFPTFAQRSRWFNRIWPYSLSVKELEGGEEGEDPFLQNKKWGIQDIAWCFAIAFAIVAGATFIAGYFPETFQSAARILIITTLAIIVAQISPVKKMKGNMDLGLFVVLFFLTTIGYSVNVQEFIGSSLVITLFCLVVVLGSLMLHTVLCRICNIDYQYVIISIVAAIASGTVSATVATSAKWKTLVSLAVVMGVIGIVLGNYLGFGIAYLIQMIIRV